MLARKHYAQKGNSKGKMNTRPVTPNSSMIINNRLRSQTSNVVKKMDDFSSSEALKQLKKKTIICDISNNISDDAICNGCNLKVGSRRRTTGNLYKNMESNSQGDYITNEAHKHRVCDDNDPKPVYGNGGVHC